MKIAICQEKGAACNVSGALALMRRRALAAAGSGADLVVFPEMFLTGYNIGRAVRELAEPSDGPSAAAAQEIARQAGVALLYGYPEQAGGRVYNSALLIDRAGRTVANYRKSHLYGMQEKRRFAPGESLVLVELDGRRIGILICYDVEFPEAVRALTLAGAELIAVPTALIRPFEIVARILVPARAIENQVFIAYAGLCGSEGELGYCGLSCIIGPDGRDLARAAAEPALLTAEIDFSAISRGRAANPYLTDRRPPLYKVALE